MDLYSVHLTSQGHYATATGLASILDGEVSHDQVGRFLRAADYNAKNVWDYIKKPLRCHEKSKYGVWVLDDTSSEKTIPMKMLLMVGMIRVLNIGT